MRERHYLRPIVPCLTFRSFPFPWRCSVHPNDISISDAIRNCLSVHTGAAGRSWVGFISMMPACVCFRKFGPCGSDKVVVIISFIVSLTFRFLLVLLFVLLFHGVVPHPELVVMSTVPAPQTLHPHIISPCRMPFGTAFPCLQAQQVEIGCIMSRYSSCCACGGDADVFLTCSLCRSTFFTYVLVLLFALSFPWRCRSRRS